jgi:lysozyme
VRLTDRPITEPEAEEYLENEMYYKSLQSAVRLCPILAMDDNRLAAISDFCYNLGAGRLQASTLRRKINQKDWPGAKKELLKWNKAGGRVLLGLVKRREVEARLL